MKAFVTTLFASALLSSSALAGTGICEGDFVPISEKSPVVKTAVHDATALYVQNPSMQSNIDRILLKTCKANLNKILKSVDINEACADTTSKGTNVNAISSFYIDCSKTDMKKLPFGINPNELVRWIVSESFVKFGAKQADVDTVFTTDRPEYNSDGQPLNGR